MSKTPSLVEVKAYWERQPLLSHEIGQLSPQEHWDKLDVLKRQDIERFSSGYWGFETSIGKRLLDIGCGPGWLTVTYAAAGAEVSAIDLTAAAVRITQTVLVTKSLKADVQVGNAEQLPFPDAHFDIVVSSGVMHHTPEVNKCFSEALRVTKPGGQGLITLYRLGVMHSRLFFPILKWAMRLTGARHPGANLAVSADSVEDFIRQYDGADNPLGIARTNKSWRRELEIAGWSVESCEVHYFPLRMVPALKRAPRWVHFTLDRWFGTMAYFKLRRPDGIPSSN
jgi:SAM-dependent methyltransferase